MKTSEIRDYMNDFCKVLNRTNERHTFKFEEDESSMRIVKYIGKFRGEVCSVLKDAKNVYRVHVSEDIKCLNTYLFDFIEDLRDYAATPFNERKDEKRWSIHFGTGSASYLNRDKNTGELFMFDDVEKYDDQSLYRTRFNRSEIADYLKTDDEAFVDNFIKRFGEEVAE